MEFERFSRPGTVPTPKLPFVTLQKRGAMSLNRASYELLGEPEAVELLYSKTDQVIGLRAIAPDHPDAFPLNASPGRRPESKPSNYTVAGKAFAKHYGIEHSVTRRYPVELTADGVLALDLKKGGSEVTSPRTKASNAQ